MTISSRQNTISLKTSISNLTADILVGRSNDHAVLRGIVFILVLYNKTFPCKVIGLSFSAPSKFDLEALEISLVLDHFYERHGYKYFKIFAKYYNTPPIC